MINIKNSKNKTTIVSMILLGLLMATMIFTNAPTAAATVITEGGPPGGGYEGPTTVPSGEIADFTISDLAFLSVSPNPIGLGQTALVNLWITFPSGEGKYMNGYKVVITDPDGQKEEVNLKSYVADGTSWFSYIPEKVGTYQFQFFFAGEYFPAGYYTNGNYSTARTGAFANAIYNPSVYCTPAESPVTNLTVQQDMVLSWSSPLPTDYWSRPIQPNNREWNAIGGNYPWMQANIVGVTGNAWHDNYYGPYIPAVNTPHIVWKRVGAMAGIIGGETGQYSQLANPGTPNVIYMGRAYQTRYETINGVPTNCAVSYDLRTGELYYAIPVAQGGVTPTHITYIYPGDSTIVPGSIASSSLTVELSTISDGRLFKINPYTGAATNYTLTSFSGNGGNAELFFRDGYYYSFQGVNTTTTVPAPDINITTAYGGYLIKWTSAGTTNNFASRIISNVSVILPTSYRTLYQTSNYGNVAAAIDYETMISVQQHRFIYGGFYGYSLVAQDLTTGKILWNYTSPDHEMSSAYRPTNAWVRDGRYIAEMERGFITAWDLHTGRELWTLEIEDYPWGEFWMYDEAAYQDLIFATGYTGTWAINQTNGEVVWQYADPAMPFETPYTSHGASTYTVQDIRVIGGLLYVSDNEHTPSQPAQRGWGMMCLDALTGELQWKLSGTRMQAGAAADGYLTAASNYDGTMYVLGKSQSKTTLSGPQVAVNQGSSVVLTGTVLDQAPASTGMACVSDESMATWMDYIHLQMPIDGIYHNITITGVPVSIDAVDPNGNYIHIGDTTSDMSGTFSYVWDPETVGKYTVTATFMGSNAYGSSYGETAVGVVAAPENTSPEPTAITMPPFETYIAGSTIAIIIAVVLVALLLRKKP
ncbi:MAG: PQQ-binding-like beta-propeller repeat protein [Candidatus Bathyarchaeia archaeon]|jgi:hypothetical protein